MSDGITQGQLTEICTASIPDSLLPLVTELTGIAAENLKLLNYCIYTTFNTDLWGIEGRIYSMRIEHEAKTYTTSTVISPPVPLDSLWFVKNNPEGSMGLIWCRLSDPPGKGNAYRIYTKRINKGQKSHSDQAYVPVRGSVFDDQFIDGKTLDFNFYRGRSESDNRTNKRHFREGDTVVVKFCSIDQPTFLFLRDFEREAASSGNPFAAPSTITSGISGGALGYFGGYGAVYDTIIAKSN